MPDTIPLVPIPLYTRSLHHPPKPYLMVRVGVTGHRSKALEEAGADQAALCKSVLGSLEKIQQIAEEIFQLNSDVYAGTGPVLRLISPLAEGADRLAARAALQLGYQLQCPLPFPKDIYEGTFETPDAIPDFQSLLKEANAVLQLDGQRSAEKEAYEAVGRLVLRQSDILISIWDGAPAGIGGTGQITREALAGKIPTVWINTKMPGSICLLTAVSETGKVEAWENNIESLADRMSGIFSLRPESEIDGFDRFRKETPPKKRFGLLFRLFCKIFVWDWELPSLKVKDFHRGSKEDWRQMWKPLPQPNSSVGTQIENSFQLPFDWADVLAEIYADRYRSSFVATYLLGACAVFAAFLGSHEKEWHIWFKGELVLIASILALVWWNRARHWHERWIDYRLLAEGFRQMQFLAPFGRVTPAFEVPAYLGEDAPGSTWFNWYFRAIVREAGLIRAEIDAPYLRICQEVLQSSLRLQVQYHGKNCGKLHRLHHHLHLLTLALFGGTLLACLLHLLPVEKMESVFGERIELILTTCAIVFPAFGAAIEGINHQGEFERIARRSHAIKSRLESLTNQISRRELEPSFRLLGRTAESFCAIQIVEQTDWRSVFISKEVNPP